MRASGLGRRSGPVGRVHRACREPHGPGGPDQRQQKCAKRGRRHDEAALHRFTPVDSCGSSKQNPAATTTAIAATQIRRRSAPRGVMVSIQRKAPATAGNHANAELSMCGHGMAATWLHPSRGGAPARLTSVLRPDPGAEPPEATPRLRHRDGGTRGHRLSDVPGRDRPPSPESGRRVATPHRCKGPMCVIRLLGSASDSLGEAIIELALPTVGPRFLTTSKIGSVAESACQPTVIAPSAAPGGRSAARRSCPRPGSTRPCTRA